MMQKIKLWIDKILNRKKFGLIPQPPDKRDYKYKLSGVLFDKVDLFENDHPIRNQGSYNSCVGHSAAYLMARFMDDILPDFNHYEKYINVSEAFIWVMAKYEEGSLSKNSGVVARNAFKVIQKYGFIGRSFYDFNNGPYKLPETNVLVLAKMQKLLLSYLPEYRAINSNLTQKIKYMKDALSTGSPISLAIPVYTNFLRYNGGVHEKDEGSFRGYHDVVIGGYEEKDGITVFKGRNSWGTWWGEKGYFYMSEKYLKDKSFDIWTLQ